MARHFKSWTEAYMEYCHNVEAPHCYKYWSALSAIAGAVERKVWFTTGKLWWYPNLYIFLVGERSTRKSSSSKVAVGLLRELPSPGVEIATAQVNMASLMRDMGELGELRSYEHFGKVYRYAPMYIYASEASMVLGGMYGKDSKPTKYLTDVYNSNDEGPLEKPQAIKSTVANKKLYVYNPIVNILACSTPTWLMTQILTKEDIEGGFGSRCTFVVYQGEFDGADGVPKVDKVQDQQLRKALIEDLTVMHKLVGGFEMTQGWHEAHASYDRRHKDWTAEMKYQDRTLMACLARKTDAQMQKVSMLLSLDEGSVDANDKLVLEDRHAHKAWELLTELETALPYAFGRFGYTDEVKHIQDIMTYIIERKAKEVEYGHLCRIFSKVHKARMIKEGLGDLEIQGRLKLNAEKSSFKQKPPKLVYDVLRH